jgi:S-adenosyl methyltransferase
MSPRTRRTASRNEQIAERLKNMPSTSPLRRGQRMSLAELAAAVNAAMGELYPERDLAAGNLLVDQRWVSDVVCGRSRWPGKEPRRRALMQVFGAATPAEIGLYPSRPTSDLAIDVTRQPAAVEAHHNQLPSTGTPVAAAPRRIEGRWRHRGLDTSKAHPARRYNYWLGGKDFFAADRESGDLIARAFPAVVTAAKENRAFLRRTVTALACAGVRQFLDIGAGLPVYTELPAGSEKSCNTHDFAQQIAPASRIIYVDNDPMVISHARARLCGGPRGHTDYLEADLREIAAMLRHPTIAEGLDLSRPVGVLLVAVLHFIHDDQQAAHIVEHLRSVLAPGSYLVISHATMDFTTPQQLADYEQMFATGQTDVRARPQQQIQGFFDGTTLIEPGLVPVSQWRPDRPADELPEPGDVAICGAVARIP